MTINDGEYRGFLKEDGTFIINGVPSGSYVVEIVNADYFYEPVFILILIAVIHLIMKLFLPDPRGNQPQG